MSAPEFLPVLSSGAHDSPKDGACFMEMASFLAGEEFSDSPQCADPFLTSVCQGINDRCTDEERATIAHLIPRVIGTRQDRDMHKVHVRLGCWAARRVLHLVREQDRGVCTVAIESAEGWCRGEVGVEEVKSAAYDAAYDAAYPAAAAAAYAYDATYAADAAAAADWKPAEFLTDLFTEFERLTGHTPAPVPAEQWAAACALTA